VDIIQVHMSVKPSLANSIHVYLKNSKFQRNVICEQYLKGMFSQIKK